jgi:hypothetical protein
VSFDELDGNFLSPAGVEAEFDLSKLSLAEGMKEQIWTEFWNGTTWMVCSILDGSRVRIDVTVWGLLLLVLWMRRRSDRVRCTLASGLLGRGKRRRSWSERSGTRSGGRVARRARDIRGLWYLE